MKIFAKIKLTSIAFLVSYQAIAENRILEQPELNEGRSMKQEMPAEDCSREQKNALDSGCINEAEYNSLVKLNYFPSCVKIRSKIRLTGWFTCGCFDPKMRIFSFNKSSGKSNWSTINDIASN